MNHIPSRNLTCNRSFTDAQHDAYDANWIARKAIGSDLLRKLDTPKWFALTGAANRRADASTTKMLAAFGSPVDTLGLLS